jgi:hypothetical protein
MNFYVLALVIAHIRTDATSLKKASEADCKNRTFKALAAGGLITVLW